MGSLYLVRHGQASFGAADYDQLSPLGHSQCLRLGQWLHARGLRFDAVLTGALRRHAQSLAAIEEGLQAQHERTVLPGLNEYDSQAIVEAIHPEPLPEADPSTQIQQYFRLLRQGLLQWMAAATQPRGLPTHAAFTAGVVDALDHVREHHADGNVLLVSSGGPISVAIGHVLGLAPEALVEINLHIRNSALSEFKVSRKRHNLLSFNTLPHLDADPASVTYA